jgi:hypothetical protein
VRVTVAIAIMLAVPAFGQQPEGPELLEALFRSAATFSRSFPHLTARETLLQKGRRGDLAILRQGRHKEIRNAIFSIPPDFQMHEVVSDYGFGPSGDNAAFHEIRHVLTLDGQAVDTKGPTRRSLTLGDNSGDDEARKTLLEELERGELLGAAADFGPLLLLFTGTRQSEYAFEIPSSRKSEANSMVVIRYRQNTGGSALTEFRNRIQTRHPIEGEIWLRESDLIPCRITLHTSESLGPKYTLRNEAEVEYQPTPYGLAPAKIVHRQYLNQDLLVENQFRYSDYQGAPFVP